VSKNAEEVALVPSGSRGIGAAIDKLLAAFGASLAISYTKDSASADDAIAFMASSGVSWIADASCLARGGSKL